MTRREALAALLFAFLLITSGLVWLFGPYGLIFMGAVLVVVVLFAVDRVPEGGSSDEALEDALSEPKHRGFPVQPRPVRR